MAKVPVLKKKDTGKVPILTKENAGKLIRPKDKLAPIKKELQPLFGEQSKKRGVFAEMSKLPDTRTSTATMDLKAPAPDTKTRTSTPAFVPKEEKGGKELRGEITDTFLAKLKKMSAEKQQKEATDYLKNNPVGQRLFAAGTTPKDIIDTANKMEEAGPVVATGMVIADLVAPERAFLGGIVATSGGAKNIIRGVKKADELASQAKKYKSAEEFVKAQGEIVYRGGEGNALDVSRGNRMGISVTKDKAIAENFMAPENGTIGEAVLPKSAKVLKEKDIPAKLQSDYINEAKELATPNNWSKQLQESVIKKQQEIIDYARNKGFEAVEFPFENEIRIIKPNTLKTKTQLEEIWKQANRLAPTKQKKTITAEVRKAATYLVKESLPVEARGKYLVAIRDMKTEKNYISLVQRVERDAQKINGLKQLSKEIRGAKDRITFIKRTAEFSQMVVTDAKKKLGIEVPTAKMTVAQLETLTDELRTRLKFKKDMGYKVPEPKIVDADMPDPNKKIFTDQFYEKIANVPEKTITQKTVKKTKDFTTSVKEGADKYLGAVSTRLGNISPDLKNAIRKMEYNLSTSKNEAAKRAIPALQAFKKMDKKDWAQLDIAFKNGDNIKIDDMAKKYGMQKELSEVRDILDDLWVRAEEVGLDVRYMDNFMPRVVKDSKGLLEYLQKGDDWSIIETALDARALKLGRALDDNEKASIINTMIRGFKSANITLTTPGALKARNIEYLDDKLNEFYAPTSEALLNYIDRVNDAIEARKFFGKQMKNVKPEDINIEDSIGYYLLKLIKNEKIKPSQEKEVREILQARFGEKGTGPILTVMKNLAYIDIMGSPLNAITQIGDLAFPIYETGVMQAGKSFVKAVAGKTKINKDDLGINRIAQEFNGASATSRALTSVFRWIGLEKMDAIGKNTMIDAVLTKMTKQAKENDPKLIEELRKIFGDGAGKVAKDLSNDKVTEDVKLLMFNKLLDFQPIALSEMPEKYLNGGNGRVFYMLKTWTIKMFDVARRESFQKLASGDKAERIEGAKNLIKLAGALVVMNATADEIKDLIMGRETSLKDRTVDNIAKLFGVNKYTLDMSEKEGLAKQLKNSILPPTQFLDNLYTDVAQSREVNELKSVKSIPVIGKLYYYWHGKGVNKQSDKGLKIKPLKMSGVKIKPLKLKTKIRPSN